MLKYSFIEYVIKVIVLNRCHSMNKKQTNLLIVFNIDQYHGITRNN